MKNSLKIILKIVAYILLIFFILMGIDVCIIHRFQNPELSETQLFLYMISKYKALLAVDVIVFIICIFNLND